MRYLILCFTLLALLAGQVYTEEEGALSKAYREVHEQSQRIRERQADYFLQKNEIERNQREWERNYEGKDDNDHYHDHDMEDHRDWDEYED